MANRSFTSSSSAPPYVPPYVSAPDSAPRVAPRVQRLAELRKRRTASRRPSGALVAVLIVVGLHLAATLWAYPHPAPRRDLRRKLAALNAGPAPSVILAGDSRIECGLLPERMAARMGLPRAGAINMGSPACDAPAVLAGYRAFRDRFADHPVVVVGISLLGVNDRADAGMVGDETLWSLGLADRLRLVEPERALLSLALPEREFVTRHLTEPLLLSREPLAVAEQGYRGSSKRRYYSAEELEHDVALLERKWFNEPVLDGIRWRITCAAVLELRAEGAQVVVLDSPLHPDLLRAVTGTRMEQPERQFHEQLRAFCREKNIPLLRYSAEALCPDGECAADPGSSFVGLVHLNRAGAERLSDHVADDLHALLAAGTLRLPADD